MTNVGHFCGGSVFSRTSNPTRTSKEVVKLSFLFGDFITRNNFLRGVVVRDERGSAVRIFENFLGIGIIWANLSLNPKNSSSRLFFAIFVKNLRNELFSVNKILVKKK